MSCCKSCGCNVCRCSPCVRAKTPKSFDGSTYEAKFSGYAQNATTSYLADAHGPVAVAQAPVKCPMNRARRVVDMTGQVEIALVAGQSVALNLLKGTTIVATVTVLGPYVARTPVKPATPIDVFYDAADQYDIQAVPGGAFDPQLQFGVVATLALTTDPKDANPPTLCKKCHCSH